MRDKRLLELDEIVNEVKESEEWEDLEMDILDYGLERGREEGREEGRLEGVKVLIKVCLEMGLSREEIAAKIQENFELTMDEIQDILF